MSSSNSPCAACKFLRRKCTQECVFAPYFPPDQPQKFADVHKVFGASNVAKLLNELSPVHREDAVNSLAYEAKARLADPVYGCVGLISLLQQKLKQVQVDLYNAKNELATYIGPSGMVPMLPNHPAGYVQQHPNNPSSSSSMIPYNMSHMLGLQATASHNAPLVIREPVQQIPNHQQQQQQMIENQQLAEAMAARERQEILRAAYERQQQQQQLQQQEFLSLNSGFEQAGPVDGSGFNQITPPALSPSLALGSFDNVYGIQEEPQEHQLLQPLMIQQQQQLEQPQQQQRSGSEEGPSIGPSC